MSEMNVEKWVEVFDASGVGPEQRARWHQEFEKRYPGGHQSFLEWLGIGTEKITAIREKSKAP